MNLPNYITVIRVLLVPVIFTYLIYSNGHHPRYRMITLTLFLIAALTDALDGFLARKFKLKTEVGTFLDPFADKLLLLCAFFGILLSDGFALKPPLWVFIVVGFRELLIICGLIIIFLTTKHIQIAPNFLGKLTTASQMLTIVSILLQWKLITAISVLTAILTVISCVNYMFKGIKLLNRLSPR